MPSHRPSLTIVLPAYDEARRIGPALNDDHSYSLQAIQRLLTGMPAAPRLGFTFVDVRDVADLHIRALTDPGARGQRFIATDRTVAAFQDRLAAGLTLLGLLCARSTSR